MLKVSRVCCDLPPPPQRSTTHLQPYMYISSTSHIPRQYDIPFGPMAFKSGMWDGQSEFSWGNNLLCSFRVSEADLVDTAQSYAKRSAPPQRVLLNYRTLCQSISPFQDKATFTAHSSHPLPKIWTMISPSPPRQ